MEGQLINYWRSSPQACDFSHFHDFDVLGIPVDGVSLINEHTLPQPSVANAGEIAKLIDQCRNETKKLPILCWDRNYFPELKDCKKELDKIIDPSGYVLLEPNDIPHWLIQCQINKIENVGEKTYRLGYLSGGLRYHRLLLANRIKPYVTKQDVVVINDYDQENYLNTIPNGCTDHMIYLEGIPWASDQSFVDYKKELGQAQQEINHVKAHPVYNTKIHIIGETGSPTDPCFVTEKTWRAMLNRCLTVTWGPLENSIYLKQSKIELLPIDEIHDANNKLDAIVDLFRNDDIDDIYNSNREMIAHNYDLVSSRQYLLDLAKPGYNKIMERL